MNIEVTELGAKRGKHQTYMAVAAAFVVVLLIAGFIIYRVVQPSGPIPKNVADKAAFSIFYPDTDVNGLKPVDSSINYSDSSDGLSYLVDVDTKPVYVSEQSTPDIFSQSGVYDYKLDQAREYDEFQTAAGTVDLTRPVGLGGQTMAWVNAKGTLLLARAVRSLSSGQWKLLFNNMIVTN